MKKGNCMRILFVILLLVLTGINLYTYCTPNFAKEMDILNRGGDENYEKIQKDFFGADKFKEQQKDYLENTFKQLNQTPEEAAAEAKKAQVKAEAWKTKAGETPILEVLATAKKEGVIKGKKDARFTIIEYSDLLCPFCQRHHNSKTLDKVMEQLPDDVNTVFRNYPIKGLHPSAPAGAEGVLCARKVGTADQYLKFVDGAFTRNSFNDDVLVGLAKEVGLNAVKFKACLDSDEMLPAIKSQIAEGSSFGVTGTPGNVIIDTKTGKYYLVAGAYPVSEFLNKITGQLDSEKTK